jgi:hypothetical protein
MFLQIKSTNQLKLYGVIICTTLILVLIFYIFKKSFRISINNYIKNHIFFLVVFSSFYFIYLVSRIFFVDSFFKILFEEDGVFEDLTSVFFITSFILFMLSLSKKKPLFINIFILALALACFYVGMEEISWGQRIFDLETPDSLKTLNYQEELNSHNLVDPSYHPTIYFIISIFCLIFFAFNNNGKYNSLFWVHKDYLPSKKFLMIALLLPFISLYNMEHFEVILSFIFFVYDFQLHEKLYKKIYLE